MQSYSLQQETSFVDSLPPVSDPCPLTTDDLADTDLEDQKIYPSDLEKGKRRVSRLVRREYDDVVYEAYAKEEGGCLVPVGIFADEVVASAAVVVAERGDPSLRRQMNCVRSFFEERRCASKKSGIGKKRR